jgi:serine/threonine protein phosphatase 1
MFLRKLFSGLSGSGQPHKPYGKEGARAYAIGDVHGCLQLLNQLLQQIEEDLRRKPTERAFLIFLGDLIDRGPDSAGVVERLLRYRHPVLRPVFLAGNHEEYFLRVLDGERGVLDTWLKYGGNECVASYGLSPDQLLSLPEDQALSLLRSKVPAEHRRFIESFGDTFRFGDYLFVHAGIRPGLPLEEQSPSDLRWIREPFLQDSGDHGFVVVHGHTIFDEVDERLNRVGIDTGAYRTGVLTCLVVDWDERYILAAPADRAKASAEVARRSGAGLSEQAARP